MGTKPLLLILRVAFRIPIVPACKWGGLSCDILGYCYAVINDYLPVFDTKFYGSIVNLSVTTGARRHHLGQRLVEQTLDWFKTKGITRVDVTVAKKNEISTKFWRKMGFGDFKEILFRNI
jgi:ribosomal protein S18 acetylase RimI-like enzyme